uniref:Thioredoxin n=1 Tax=Diabrotica virgifera virgifera TaxID=50390 RepID=A0A6P7FQL6_DIAVI
MIIEIKEDHQMEELMTQYKSQDMLVVVEFYANWCAPCRNFVPVLHETAEKYKEMPILLVDVDTCDDIAHTYRVMATPYFLFYKKGVLVDKFAGANIEKLQN